MDYIREIDRIVTNARVKLKDIDAEMEQLPDGKLMISKGKNKPEYYCVSCGNGKFMKKRIPSDSERVAQLARKQYLLYEKDDIIKITEIFETARKSLRSREISNIYKALPGNFDLLPKDMLLTPSVPILQCPNPTSDPAVPIRQLCTMVTATTPMEWMAMLYRQNQKEADRKNSRAGNGLMLRSKGELQWVELMGRYGLAYHYDELMRYGSEWISPDFSVLRFDGKLIYIEHCGMIGSPGYMQSLLRKLQIYYDAGIRLGDNLILTFDNPDGGIDVELMQAELKNKQLI